MPARSRSLRFKLSLWFLLVYFLIQSVLVGGVLILRRGSIRSAFDGELAGAAEALVENILVADPAWSAAELEALIPRGSGFLLLTVRDRRGEPLVAWRVPADASLPFSAWELVPAGPVGGVYTTIGPRQATALTGEEAPLRLVTLPFRREGELYYLQAAVRDQQLERLLGPFFDLVVVGVPLGLAAALLAGWIIAGRAVAPIERLSHAARGVSPDRLSERFDVPTTDQEVARLERELNSALERLEAGYRAQDQFVTNISHELKTPIAVLLTQAQVIRMGEPAPERAVAFVEHAEHALRRLGTIVESFLILARADREDESPAGTVELPDLVLDCVQHCRAQAVERGVRLVPQLDDAAAEADALTLEGDSGLVRAMVENLVRNAIRHSPQGATVTLEVQARGDVVRIAVGDEGPGIPEEYAERVFDRFFQVPGGHARSEGSGLGLAIASGVARLHAGTIAVRSRPGGGCSFVVELPRRRAQAP